MRFNMGRVACYFVSLSSVTCAPLRSRWGGGFSYGDNSSQVTLVLHCAGERAAAGSDDATPPHNSGT